jgi:hypothetical protein
VIFVDTSAWFALAVPWDENHSAAIQFLGSNRESLLTTDYIVDETLTLLVMRRQKDVAIAAGERLMRQKDARLLRVAPVDIDTGWQMFRQYRDKEWSFTDCVSFALIGRLKIATAFSFDKHFHQFGSVTVVPSLDIK